MGYTLTLTHEGNVSMKSGLEGRNNADAADQVLDAVGVSMKSGLEGRNNRALVGCRWNSRV